jgi:hypothetical protein
VAVLHALEARTAGATVPADRTADASA